MKMYAKADLEYKNGYIVDKQGEVVAIDNEIVDLFNKLETDMQHAYWEKGQPKIELPSIEKFSRVSERGNVYAHIEANTPKLDKEIDKAIAIMDELDAVDRAKKVNDYFNGIVPIQLFIADENIVACESAVPHRFDLPLLGNPLEMTKQKLAGFVIDMFCDDYNVTEDE